MARQDEPNKVIYSMVGVGKIHGTKQVLKDIYLGYFYRAKIGVMGFGSGNSTPREEQPHQLPRGGLGPYAGSILQCEE
ncbi:MAG TPA: hypothetical protein VMT45_11005 [Thermoanaerobaculaceae bacterium]|nr:hypothetical protein [Thermoanaerobaculaceae bacterium]